MRRKAILLILTMAATLVLAGGMAFAVNKACPPGSGPGNPCTGTAKTKTASGNDTLIGTGGTDYIAALSGNDKIAAGAGNDTTNGGPGNDTYSYRSGWGTDTLVDASGVDTLNFSAVSGGITAILHPEYSTNPQNQVSGPSGEVVNASLSPLSTIEKVVGSASGFDIIFTGQAANILQPGPGEGGADFQDLGGCSSTTGCSPSIPPSNDTYSGFAASGYGAVPILDHGGTADKLVLPFASTDAYFEAFDQDSDGSADTLIIMSTSTDFVTISGQLEPYFGRPGHIETIQFTDGNLPIGSATQAQQSASGAKQSTTTGSSSAEARVAQLNEASTLDEAEKEERSEAAKKLLSQAPPSPPTGPDDDTKPPDEKEEEEEGQ